MTPFDRGLELVITIVLIVGGYQFYFWCQRQKFFPARQLTTCLDGKIAYDPRWVWVYSGLYYPMILLAALSMPTWQAFVYGVGCFLLLLAVQMQFFIFLPVEIPYYWRTSRRVKRAAMLYPRSQSFMDRVWTYDKLRNSMPSMHVSVATMVDLTIWSHWPVAGYVGGLFPLLIAISALKTKQHYVVDVVPGAALGALVFWAWHFIPI